MNEDELDLEDGGVGGDEEENSKKVQTAPAAIATLSESAITHVASQIVSKVMDSLSASASRDMGGRKSAVIQWAEDQLRNKVDPRAVESLLALKAATDADSNYQQQASQPATEVNKYNNGVWEVVEEIFDELADHVPGGLKDARASLLDQVQKELLSNPEFADDQEKIKQFKKPSRKSIKLAAAIVIDKKLKREGRTNVTLPVDRTSSKPAAPPAIDPLASLTKPQRAFYDGFKSEYKGQEKELLKIAKTQ